MQIGKLDQKMELQSFAEVNDSGSLKPSYTTVANVWGKVTSPRGNQAFEAARNVTKETIRVQLRLRSDVNEKWRLVWLDKIYNIVTVDRSQHRRNEMWVTAELQT